MPLSPVSSTVESVRATSRMADYYATELPVLARDKVRYVGEPVVAVIADSRALAEDAAERVEVDYITLPPLSDPEAAAEAGAALLHEDAQSNVIFTRQFVRGEVDDAMAAAASTALSLASSIVTSIQPSA